ncbi:YhcN/YlaJ family sporulation lipoprotein [Bacillus swezeyi]|uniref:Sporulation protein n=1 Tax=Bacillus swezeyi TaxID=1925020 RepID=A0A1R1QEJ2_9BACI|nr:YhcN/YlaJ family sporulation lipoprotein [Bacillus swezeyi]MEC1262124.1 YhcN/YlaJ family sporulation lipoprotein [Bacillus swezeyi]MED2927308.1 YhcN/YlaJ family sporulation lipoprotein [Bacillus swezeyi]MED2941561.1 YhcN/YlaJ family sporulation lipoprotein [Bacillus swezeyi]MED2962506.1 YhcN/YlaJ family sporulation lipoprotein [Bacillus swezeyi]MED3072039.1 YhcN/YlaJ family sporulation lipoprotein [Bacillus swezeyi]
MNKKLFLFGLLLAPLVGCQTALNDTEHNIYEEDGNTVHVADKNPQYNERFRNDDRKGRFGYARHQATPVANKEKMQAPQINREEMAHIISSLTVQLPNIQDASTLVTDEEALVVYKTDSKKREETADQVKKTAASVIPRYYKIYISDDANLIQSVANFSRLGSNSRNVDQLMADTIKEMQKSPQGKTTTDTDDETGLDGQGKNMES